MPSTSTLGIKTSDVPVMEDGNISDVSLAPDDASQDVAADAETNAEWGEPIQAKPNSWQWVPFPGTACADGSPTGLGVNLSPGATRAFIYFEGGGACWDYGHARVGRNQLSSQRFR